MKISALLTSILCTTFLSTSHQVSALADNTAMANEVSTEIISISSAGFQLESGYNQLYRADMSNDGRFVVFSEKATGLVNNERDFYNDLYLRDRLKNTTIKITTGVNRSDSNGDVEGSFYISGDGRYVVFNSAASNLIADDNNQATDMFIYTIADKTISRIPSNTGAEPKGITDILGISRDGSKVLFWAREGSNYTNNREAQGFIFDRNSEQNTEVEATYDSSLSSNGEWICHVTHKPLLNSDTNNSVDIYLINSNSDERIRLTAGFDESRQLEDIQRCGVSHDGSYVSFRSINALVEGAKQGLQNVYFMDVANLNLELISIASAENSTESNFQALFDIPTISDNGQYVAFLDYQNDLVANDTNGLTDLFVRDRFNDTTHRVSLTENGGQIVKNDDEGYRDYINAITYSMTPDGQYFLFGSEASGIVSGDQNNRFDYFIRGPKTYGEPAKIKQKSSGLSLQPAFLLGLLLICGGAFLRRRKSTNN